jgi:broad specificity phosphatase PhoE
LKLILVRHGETLWNRENRIQGHTDVELSDYGRMQVEKLALSMVKDKIDAIYSSPLKRAYDTAQAIARFHDTEIKVEPKLRELNHGDFESLTIQELKESHGAFLKEWIENPASVFMPNGESLAQVQERVWDVMGMILETSRDTLVVSHGMAIMTILCKIQNLSLTNARQMFVNMASKTIVSFENGHGTVLLLNDTSHLNDMVERGQV